MRNALRSGGLSLGAWCGIPSSYATEVVCAAGYDWICIDTQHGMVDYPDVLGMLQASALAGVPALVRVPAASDVAAIMRALDSGAVGVIVPVVNSRLEAEQAVAACRYPPAGSRSWGPTRAVAGEPEFSARAANEHVVCAIQIETLEALENLDDILAVPGLDVAFAGPSDLALAMDLAPGPRPQPGDHAAALRLIVDRCREFGIRPGAYGGSADIAAEYIDLGFDFVAIANDAQLLREGARRSLADVRAREARVAVT
jgi:4-hydroxy-2-oxoheptanedioate aldolase